MLLVVAPVVVVDDFLGVAEPLIIIKVDSMKRLIDFD